MPDELTTVLARNLKRFMEELPEPLSQNQIAKRAKVAQTSVGYMLNPEGKPRGTRGKPSTPTLGSVERVAKVLGKEAWQLLHPNPDEAPLSAAERARYEEFQASMKRLRALENENR